jgi:copper chaperone
MSTASKTYEVRGMTCEHCATSVREEIGELGDVEILDLDLDTGRLLVAGTSLSDERLAAVIDEAGYELAGADR